MRMHVIVESAHVQLQRLLKSKWLQCPKVCLCTWQFQIYGYMLLVFCRTTSELKRIVKNHHSVEYVPLNLTVQLIQLVCMHVSVHKVTCYSTASTGIDTIHLGGEVTNIQDCMFLANQGFWIQLTQRTTCMRLAWWEAIELMTVPMTTSGVMETGHS